MIFILFKKITATALACFIAAVSSAGYFENDNWVNDNLTPKTIVAEAAVSVTKPTLKLIAVHSDRIYISISNLSKYKSDTVFNVYINNELAYKNVTVKAIKNNRNYITLNHDAKVNFKPQTAYSIKVKAVYKTSTSDYSNKLKVNTNKTTYFNLNKGTQFYKLQNSKMVKSTKITSSIVTTGILTTSTGTAVSGKSFSKYKAEYIKVTQGKYKGYFIKISSNTANRISATQYKRRIVTDYAASMNGGRYVYGGCSYRATDCSGLVMLSYSQIGVNLPHSARAQATKGKSVSQSNMQAGDIIIMNGGSHVGMYIDNNQIVHAMNSRDGIKIQPVSYLKYYSVNSVRRII